jgi:CheY-like chemotaxis protein/LmbE family N-acetylglucosaminyl deacetylase
MTGTERNGPPGRILLIEDDPVAAHFAMQVLGKRGGFDVRHTPDPAVALQLAGSEAWDLVLTDAELPGMTGLELLAALRQLAPALPVAVITAHEAADPAVQPLRAAADEFLQKPVRPQQLRATAAALAAKGRAARLAARQSVLAIGAHPGDAEIGAAGVLLVHRGLGDEVSILTLSRHAGDDTANAAAGQSEMAALALGASLFLADLPDSGIGTGAPAVSAIDRAVQAVRPGVIYTHSPHDLQQDHRDAYQATMTACREAGRVYCFQSPSASVDFRPARFAAIDEQLDRKLLAVNAFAARKQIRAWLEHELVESAARYWSRFAGGHCAEAFEVVRENPAPGQPAERVPRPATPHEDC